MAAATSAVKRGAKALTSSAVSETGTAGIAMFVLIVARAGPVASRTRCSYHDLLLTLKHHHQPSRPPRIPPDTGFGALLPFSVKP